MLKLFSSPGRTGGLFPRLKAPIKTVIARGNDGLKYIKIHLIQSRCYQSYRASVLL